LVSKCLEIGAQVSQSVLMPKCLVAEVSGNRYQTACYTVYTKSLFSLAPDR